jgi:uncharacterized protein YndB with AHSA1/START domain
MQSIKKTVDINAPVKQVFEFVTQPTNLPKFWPNMVEVSNARREANGSQEFDWVYKMAGIHFKGHAKTLLARPNEYLEIKNEAGIPSTFKWTYEARGNNTRISLEVEYSIPMPVIGKLAEAVVVKLNERDADSMLANLKTTCESFAQAGAGAAAPA